ncbi:NAD(P)H nitroreductase [Thaumasiovibrio subtropicus]|uniref:NAD(P)H nitroreductase n=1 Tax=Thaumasiovibrio subtropicus TaxID=1891207 RepID=UPI000B35DDDF|nr:NAD(P)H nitroreductase [Thaumasiovibrio subtropicus]
MDALELLLERRSLPKLVSPAPQGRALENILKAGLRAPDHGALTPWRFIVAVDDGLQRLADILVAAATADNADEGVISKASKAPFRAPMVITVVAKVSEHDKVPAIEQIVSAGCATHAMQMAAVAHGFGGFWRTGNWAYHPVVKKALGLSGDDEIVGFLYIGTPNCVSAKVPQRDIDKFVSYL